MKIILGKNEVENAIQCYLSREGINTDKYDLDIKIVVTRSSDDTKIEVDMETKKVIDPAIIAETDPVSPATSPFGSDETTSE